MKRLQLERIHTVLLDAVIAKADVQTIFDRLYEVTNLPAICFDPTFSLVAYSFRRPFYFVHWEMIAANGRSPDGIIKEYDYLTDQEKMVRCGSASIFDDRASAGYPQACGPVFVNGQLCCYCGIMVEDAEQSDVIAASDMLAQAIAATMRREMRSRFDPSFLAMDEIGPCACAAIEKDGGAYLFSVLTCRKHSTSVLQFIRQSIESRNSHCITHIHNDGRLYMLFSCLGRREELETVTALISRLCAEHMAFAGVSDYFYDIKSLPLHRRQAEVTLSVAQALEREPKAYHFLELYCSVIWQAAIERLGCEVCTYPAVTMLDGQDALYNTDYLKTLDAWLGNFNRKSVAATILGTHKTTVTNRLMKISELSGVDVFGRPYEFQTGIELYRFMRQSGGQGGAEMSLETKKQAFRPDLLKHLSSADSFTRLLDGVAEENRLDIALIGADLAQIYRTPEQDLVELPPVDMLLSAVMQNRAVITVLPSGAPAAIFPISSDTFNVAVVVSYPAEYDVDDVLRFGYELVRLQAYFRDNDGGEQAVSLNNAIIAQHLFVEDRKSVFALLADEFRISPFSGEPLFRADYVVASICTQKGGVTAEMQQALSRYVPDTFSMEKNGSLCAFMHGLKPGGLNSNQVLVEALKNYCGAYELRCVLSSPFSELNMRFKYMEQAELLSASFAEEGRLGLICADDEFTRTVLSGAIDKLGAELLCLTDIQRIADYDRENGTNYLDTLEKYLSCANRFTEASKELYIDRGTLKYRLNKIRSLIFCDPEEPGIAQRLRYAVYIYRKSGEKTGMD